MRVFDGLDPHEKLIDFLINRNSCPKSHWGAYSDPTDPCLDIRRPSIRDEEEREGSEGRKQSSYILYRFQDIASYLSKFADLPIHLRFVPQRGMISMEFRRHLWHRKTRFPGLLCSIVCVLAVCDGQSLRTTIAYTAP